MKILHINCNYDGTLLHRRMIEHLNDCQSENGEKIGSCIFVPVYKGKEAEAYTEGAEVVISQCFQKWHRLFFDWKQHLIMRSLQKSFEMKQFDCIHAYTLFSDGNSARKMSKKYHIPYVVAVRDTDVNAFFKKAFYLRGRGVKIFRDASFVFFLSENYRKIVLENYVPKKFRKVIYEKSLIVPNGIDDFWLQNIYKEKESKIKEIRESINNRRLKIVYAGVIRKRKNIIATQKALQILREKGWNVSFMAVGRLDEQDVYEEMITYPDTQYIEQQPKEKLVDYYRESDIFVMPSHTETFGLVYAEAMSQGLPVLYTKGQGFDGQFPDGEVGYAVEDLDPADIANKIILTAKNYEELCRNCLNKAHRFDWKDICNQYAGLYSKVITNTD